MAQSSKEKFANNNNNISSQNKNNSNNSTNTSTEDDEEADEEEKEEEEEESSDTNLRPTLGSPTSNVQCSNTNSTADSDNDNHSIGTNESSNTSTNIAEKIVGRLGVDLTSTTAAFSEVPSYLIGKKENGRVNPGNEKLRLLRLSSVEGKTTDSE